MGLVLYGMSHHTAPLALREQVVYDPQEAMDTLRGLRERGDAPQALLLSTCNRTELYAVVPEAGAGGHLVDSVFLSRAPEQNGAARQALYERRDADAVRHLFRVACGLDSMVVGEPQILGQVKTAYEWSCQAETAGTLLHRLASRAFHMGKRARSETAIGAGAVSVAFAAVELAEKVFGKLSGRGVLVIGAGENGALCAEHMRERLVSPLLVTNRTPDKARALADALGGEAVPFSDIDAALRRVDIVISTTGSPEVVLSRDRVAAAHRERGNRQFLLMDLAVPRDIDPGVDELPEVFRFDMDALQDIVRRNETTRMKELPRVESMVAEETDRFMKWLEGLSASPVIRDLHGSFEAIRARETERNAHRFPDAEALDTFSRNLVRKLLMDVTKEIKGYRAESPVHAERLAALRHLFGLDAKREERDDDL